MDVVADGAPPPLLRPKPYSSQSLFTPEKLVRESRRQRGVSAGPIPPIVVLDPDGDLTRYLRAAGSTTIEQWSCYHTDMLGFTVAGVEVGVVANVVGGPYAVLIAEQAFAWGAELIIDLTSAGRVADLGLSPPYFLVVERAWRDEGTSLHYLPPSTWAVANAGLLADLRGLPDQVDGQRVVWGASWTTDAPFRETAEQLREAADAGVGAVEMEAASLYAFAEARDCPVLCLAQITNNVDSAESDDFEKGEHGGASAALGLLRHVVLRLRMAGGWRLGDAVAGDEP